MIRKIEKDKLDYNGAMKLLQRQGGLTSYFGTSDSRVVEKMAEEGDHDAQLVYEAMALGVARGLARLAVLVKGKVDYFVLTGGIAYSKSFCEMVKDYAGFLGEFVVVPGENEMQALADGCLRVLGGRGDRAYLWLSVNCPPRAAILAAGCIMFLFTGTIYAWSILSSPFPVEFGWTSAQLGLNFTIVMSWASASAAWPAALLPAGFPPVLPSSLAR